MLKRGCFFLIFLVFFIVSEIFGLAGWQQVAIPDGLDARQQTSFVIQQILPPVTKYAANVASHASSAGIVFTDAAGNVTSAYISTNNYVARENSAGHALLGGRTWIPSKMQSGHAGNRTDAMPLPHSEIAAIQHMSNSINPAVTLALNDGSFLGHLLGVNLHGKVTIIIKNSSNIPCSSNPENPHTHAKRWGPGIDCDTYLQSLANKICMIYGNCEIYMPCGSIHLGYIGH